LPPVIAGIFLLSLGYWLYLAFCTRMIIVYDCIEYRYLGKFLLTKGLIGYLKAGPLREPLYPLLVAASMGLEQLTGLAYVQIMAGFGVLILLLSQVLTYTILRLLNIRQWITASVLIYFAVSPSLNNAAFSLFSEIVELPLFYASS